MVTNEVVCADNIQSLILLGTIHELSLSLSLSLLSSPSHIINRRTAELSVIDTFPPIIKKMANLTMSSLNK